VQELAALVPAGQRDVDDLIDAARAVLHRVLQATLY